MTSEDRAEQDNLRRLRRFLQLRRDVDAAERLAEARLRLELQLVHVPVATPHRIAR
jgi:hypothetical protein